MQQPSAGEGIPGDVFSAGQHGISFFPTSSRSMTPASKHWLAPERQLSKSNAERMERSSGISGAKSLAHLAPLDKRFVPAEAPSAASHQVPPDPMQRLHRCMRCRKLPTLSPFRESASPTAPRLMPEDAKVEYHRNLKRIEIDVLRSIEPALKAALESRQLFGRAKWIAKVDPHNRTFYVLERVQRSGEMEAYVLFDEIGGLDFEKLRDLLMTRRRYDGLLTERPLLFEELSSEQRAAIANEYLDSTIILPKHVAKIESLAGFPPAPSMPTHVENPPTYAALTDRGAAQILVGSGSDAAGAWLRLYIMVYRNGGRIFFRELDASDVEAVVRFHFE